MSQNLKIYIPESVWNYFLLIIKLIIHISLKTPVIWVVEGIQPLSHKI